MSCRIVAVLYLLAVHNDVLMTRMLFFIFTVLQTFYAVYRQRRIQRRSDSVTLGGVMHPQPLLGAVIVSDHLGFDDKEKHPFCCNPRKRVVLSVSLTDILYALGLKSFCFLIVQFELQ